MPMQALTTMSLLGALNAVTPSPGLVQAKAQVLPHFAETLVQAGVPAGIVAVSPWNGTARPVEVSEPVKTAQVTDQSLVAATHETAPLQVKIEMPAPHVVQAKVESPVAVDAPEPPAVTTQEAVVAMPALRPVSVPAAQLQENAAVATPLPADARPVKVIEPPPVLDKVTQPVERLKGKDAPAIKAAKPAKEVKSPERASTVPTQALPVAGSDALTSTPSPLPVEVASSLPLMPRTDDVVAPQVLDIAAEKTVSTAVPIPSSVPMQTKTPAQTHVSNHAVATASEEAPLQTEASAQTVTGSTAMPPAPPMETVVTPVALPLLPPSQTLPVHPVQPVSRVSAKQSIAATNVPVVKHAVEAAGPGAPIAAPVTAPAPVETVQHPASHVLSVEPMASTVQAISAPAPLPARHPESAAPVVSSHEAVLASPSTVDHGQPTLVPHTTLNASPTVLEVGVPGGSHGWLRIRAEMSEGGTVQASLTATSSAGHESLHRDLPAMNAFLSSEQVAVQLHVVEPVHAMPSAPSIDGDSAQGMSTGQQGGGNEREAPSQQPGETYRAPFTGSTDTAWTTVDSSGLPGGSWVNVVA